MSERTPLGRETLGYFPTELLLRNQELLDRDESGAYRRKTLLGDGMIMIDLPSFTTITSIEEAIEKGGLFMEGMKQYVAILASALTRNTESQLIVDGEDLPKPTQNRYEVKKAAGDEVLCGSNGNLLRDLIFSLVIQAHFEDELQKAENSSIKEVYDEILGNDKLHDEKDRSTPTIHFGIGYPRPGMMEDTTLQFVETESDTVELVASGVLLDNKELKSDFVATHKELATLAVDPRDDIAEELLTILNESKVCTVKDLDPDPEKIFRTGIRYSKIRLRTGKKARDVLNYLMNVADSEWIRDQTNHYMESFESVFEKNDGKTQNQDEDKQESQILPTTELKSISRRIGAGEGRTRILEILNRTCPPILRDQENLPEIPDKVGEILYLNMNNTESVLSLLYDKVNSSKEITSEEGIDALCAFNEFIVNTVATQTETNSEVMAKDLKNPDRKRMRFHASHFTGTNSLMFVYHKALIDPPTNSPGESIDTDLLVNIDDMAIILELDKYVRSKEFYKRLRRHLESRGVDVALIDSMENALKERNGLSLTTSNASCSSDSLSCMLMATIGNSQRWSPGELFGVYGPLANVGGRFNKRLSDYLKTLEEVKRQNITPMIVQMNVLKKLLSNMNIDLDHPDNHDLRDQLILLEEERFVPKGVYNKPEIHIGIVDLRALSKLLSELS